MKTHKPTQTTRIAILIGTCAALINSHIANAAPAAIAGPLYNSTTKHFYYLLESANWQDSEDAAVALGGNLATINDATENQWVIGQFQSFGGLKRHLWIGLNDFDNSQGIFTWSNDETTTYRPWFNANQPDLIGTERAVLIFGTATASNSGKWNNYIASFTSITTAGFQGPINGVVEVGDDCCTPPDANNDTFNYSIEHPSFPLQLNVLGNDTEPKALPMTIVNVFPPELATISPTGTSLQFTPGANFNGTASVWYEVSNGDCSDWAVATLHFDNNPPVAVNDYATIFEYTGNTYITVDARLNDMDDTTDRPNLKVIGFVPPVTGTVAIVSNKLQFRCNNNFSGQENFAYTISDGFGGTSSARVFITARRKAIFTGQLEITSGERVMLDIQTTPTGKYTGKVCIGDNCFTLQGVIKEGQPTTQTIKRKGQPDLFVELELVDGQLEATVTDGAKVATGPIEQAATLSVPAYYTFLIDQPGAAAPMLKGAGYGGLKVNANGTFTINGKLSDGKAYASSGNITTGNIAIFYKTLPYPAVVNQGAIGSLLGAIALPQSGTYIIGDFTWKKPQQSQGVPAAQLSLVLPMHGEQYIPPASGQLPLVLNAGSAMADFDVAPNHTPNSVNVTFLPNGVIQQTSGNASITLKTKFFPASGFFGGSGYSTTFSTDPKQQKIQVGGVLLQGSQNLGAGQVLQKPFLGSGLIELLP